MDAWREGAGIRSRLTYDPEIARDPMTVGYRDKISKNPGTKSRAETSDNIGFLCVDCVPILGRPRP
jgi:hypothetical protein